VDCPDLKLGTQISEEDQSSREKFQPWPNFPLKQKKLRFVIILKAELGENPKLFTH